jgi:CheY-like chemotaxis protein
MLEDHLLNLEELWKDFMATILVIDDQEAVRALLRFTLESVGHEVLEAANGRLGLALFRERGADLIITDIAMPEMNGLELMLELTRHFINVKVIAISGAPQSGSDMSLDKAKLLGARHTFQKPFDMHALLSAVQYDLLH